MTKLTNEELQHIVDNRVFTIAHQSMASELLSLRKLRDSAPSFDESHLPGHMNKTWIDGARWQHSQDQLAYAALKDEAEKMAEALENLSERHRWHPDLDACICVQHKKAEKIVGVKT